ncbi:hypothetical protein H4582DRAFT_2073071 [Lactarius indigo]|nr:hypothetical protein H4582DRAFT_2073071 [Lactarius indigo]
MSHVPLRPVREYSKSIIILHNREGVVPQSSSRHYIFSLKQVSVRIVIGSKAIYTSVGKVQGVEDLWRCTGSVPEFGAHRNASSRSVIVSIQALDGWRVIDTQSFGYFTYWEYGKLLAEPSEATTLLDVERPSSGHRALLDQGPQSTITQVIPAHNVASPVPSAFPKRLPRRSPSSENGPYDKVLLDFEAEPADLGKNLSSEEKRRRRRLIQFYCEQVREHDTLYPPPLSEKMSTRNDKALSSPASGVRTLLEYLVQDRFLADERSRVRRNVEHLRPITVSKTRMSKLFSTIMNLPSPKPRNIEKDCQGLQVGSSRGKPEQCHLKIRMGHHPITDPSPNSSTGWTTIPT